jgi:hypothetical protein
MFVRLEDRRGQAPKKVSPKFGDRLSGFVEDKTPMVTKELVDGDRKATVQESEVKHILLTAQGVSVSHLRESSCIF